MSRTKRIYNKKPIEGGPGFKGWITTEVKQEILQSEKRWYNKSMRPEDGENPFISMTPWMTYHPYRQVCCGHCKHCKDPTISKRRRLANKRDLYYFKKMAIGSIWLGDRNLYYFDEDA